MSRFNSRPPSKQGPLYDRRPISPETARLIINHIERLSAAGLDGDDLLFALDAQLPTISFAEYLWSLALHRAESGAPTYGVVLLN